MVSHQPFSFRGTRSNICLQPPTTLFFHIDLTEQPANISGHQNIKTRANTATLIMNSRPRQITPIEWDRWKDTILALRRGKSLKEVIALMRNVHGFSA
ncbi:hypothetical protein V8E51_011044, partial [Hyaloscypha variabilis]